MMNKPDFSDRHYSDTEIETYLAGKMDTAQAEDFEIRLLTDTDLQSRTESLQMLKSALSEHQSLLHQPEAPGLLNRLLTFVATPAWSYAASTALLVAGFMLFHQEQQTDYQLGQIIYLDQTRSAAATARVTLPVDAAVLAVDAIAFNGESVSAEWRSASQTIELFRDVKPDRNLQLNLLIPDFKADKAVLRLWSANHEEIYELVRGE